ncbi:MAG: dUTP diphosphatase [Bacteroidetes bacterium]|nr:MAG: dUTP diphosphatase [Bacteroidota bacterium]
MLKEVSDSLFFWKDKGARPVWIPPIEDDLVVKVKKLTSTAIVPTKSRKTDAGYDLYADEDKEIPPERTILISTGISFAIPDGYAGLIWDRSGLGSKGIHRHAGVVDSSYRGEVKVCLSNSLSGHHSAENSYFVSKGDRIAQILFQKVPHFDLVETEELDDTDRGSSGFGSSGK